MSWITDPQTGDSLQADKRFTIKGFAFAGSRGIRLVELSTNGGESWEPSQLAPALSPYSWVMWTYEWQPTQSGDHRILARAIDGTETRQIALEHESFPGGASGIQEVIVSI